MPRRMRTYSRFLRWIWRDALWRHRWLVARVVGGGALAVIFQIQAIALAIYYASLFERGDDLTLLGRTIDVRESTGFLVVVGSVVGGLVLLGAVLQYYGQISMLRLRRRHSEHCADRAIALLRRETVALPRTATPLDPRGAMEVAYGDSMMCGRVVAILVRGITPLISAIIGAIVLLAVHVWLTVALGIVAGIGAVFILRVNVAGSRHSAEADRTKRLASAEFRGAIQAAAMAPRGGDGDTDEAAGTPGSWPGTAQWLDAYIGRLRAVFESDLIMNVIMAIALGGILVGLGLVSIESGRGWEVIAIYIIALRYAIVNLSKAVRTVTGVNRFYPQVRRYMAFVMAVPRARATRATGSRGYVLVSQEPRLPGAVERMDVRAGDRIAVVATSPITRYALPVMLSRLLEDGAGRALHEARFVHGSGANSDPAPVGHVSEWLGESGQTPPVLVSAAAALDDAEAGWIVVEARELLRLQADVRERMLGAFAERIVIIAHDPGVTRVGDCGETVVGVMESGEVHGLGDVAWYSKHAPVLSGQRDSADDAVLFDDDDDD